MKKKKTIRYRRKHIVATNTSNTLKKMMNEKYNYISVIVPLEFRGRMLFEISRDRPVEGQQPHFTTFKNLNRTERIECRRITRNNNQKSWK